MYGSWNHSHRAKIVQSDLKREKDHIRGLQNALDKVVVVGGERAIASPLLTQF